MGAAGWLVFQMAALEEEEEEEAQDQLRASRFASSPAAILPSIPEQPSETARSSESMEQ